MCILGKGLIFEVFSSSERIIVSGLDNFCK
jgi:hypothetical protein